MTLQDDSVTPIEFTFDHVHLICESVDEAEQWFQSVLNATVVARSPMNVSLAVGGGTVLLRPGRPGEPLAPASAERGFGLDHFGLRVADTGAFIETVRSRGAVVLQEPTELGPGIVIAFIQGPAKTWIEVIQRPGAGDAAAQGGRPGQHG